MSRRVYNTPANHLLGFKGYHETVRVPQLAEERKRRQEEQRKREAEEAAKLPMVVCESCHKGYGMRPDCPVFDRVMAGRRRDPKYQYVISLFECPRCSFSQKSLGWCIIEDSFDEDFWGDTPEKRKELRKYKDDEIRKLENKIKAGESMANTLIPFGSFW